MNPLTWGLAWELLVKHGPSAVIFAQKIRAQIKAGREQTEVSDADIAELVDYWKKTPDDYLRELGIGPPKPPA